MEPWSLRPLAERTAVLERYGVELAARKEDLALAISRDMGKLLTEARLEVGAMIAKVGISIGAQAERAGDTALQTDFGQLELTHRPHGVMAVFGPYNFPGHLPNGHLVPALLVNAPEWVNGLHDGRLADVAPTLLQLMGLAQPAEMTGRSLIDGGADAAREAAE